MTTSNELTYSCYDAFLENIKRYLVKIIDEHVQGSCQINKKKSFLDFVSCTSLPPRQALSKQLINLSQISDGQRYY